MRLPELVLAHILDFNPDHTNFQMQARNRYQHSANYNPKTNYDKNLQVLLSKVPTYAMQNPIIINHWNTL